MTFRRSGGRARRAGAGALCLLPVLLASACGGDGGGGADGGSGDFKVPDELIGGQRRLAWSQRAASVEVLNTFTFVLFVDGMPTALDEVRCTTTQTSVGFVCTARPPSLTPGQHTLELVATVNGVQSDRSDAIPVNGSVTPQTMMPAAPAGSRVETAPGAGACTVSLSDGCYGASLAIEVPGEISIPVQAGDGLLFVEDGRRIRMVDATGRLASEPWLALDAPSDRIVGLAAHPGFASNRLVYVAWVESRIDGAPQLNVTRYRELAGVLGEGAMVLTGLAAPSAGAAPLAVDDAGQIYVALRQDGAADPRAPGVVARFAADGTVPRTQHMGSPVLGYGFARPSDLARDTRAGRVWIAGAGGLVNDGLAVFAPDAPGGTWPATPAAAAAPAGENARVDERPFLSLAPAARAGLWFIPSAGRVYRASLAADGSAGPFSAIDFSALGPVTHITEMANTMFAVSRAGNQQGDITSRIWRLLPGQR